MMKRREFLAATPRGVLSQAARIPRVALFGQQPLNEITEHGHPFWSTLIGELRRLGHTEGQTLVFESGLYAKLDAGGTA